MLTYETLLDGQTALGNEIVFDASAEIENLCDEIGLQVDKADGYVTETMGPCAVLRALHTRIKSLNSVIMSSTSRDDVSVIESLRKIYGPSADERFSQYVKKVAGMPSPSPESDFMEGVGLALSMLQQGKDLPHDQQDSCELNAKYRGGKPQNNFALMAVQTLIECPELAEGFAAVLSNYGAVMWGGAPNPAELAALTYARIGGRKTSKTVKQPAASPEAVAA